MLFKADTAHALVTKVINAGQRHKLPPNVNIIGVEQTEPHYCWCAYQSTISVSGYIETTLRDGKFPFLICCTDEQGENINDYDTEYILRYR